MKTKDILKSKKFYGIMAVVLIAAITFLYANHRVIRRVVGGSNHDYNDRYYIVNNVRQDRITDKDLAEKDVKEIQIRDSGDYMINHSRGFAIEFPNNMYFDLTAGNEFISAVNSEYSIVVSKEFSPYEDVRGYIRDYLHKYLLSERYMEQNKITLHKDAVEKINDFWVQVVFATRTPAPGSTASGNYAYCYIYDAEQRYYRIMVKGGQYNEDFINTVYRMLYSFTLDVPIQGISQNYTDYKPIPDENWNEETRKFYDDLCNSDKMKWGIYVPQGVRDMHFDEVEDIERKINYKFEGMIEYLYLDVEGEDVPVEGMTKAWEDGKVTELTLQVSTVMNEELDGYTPAFDALDGVKDDKIREFARQAKEFGHPFFFRLNNEMNSDWVSYCSSCMMNDPELYVRMWHRIYGIFREEGVENAIWVFNPNNVTFPPCGYNDPMAYYPGNGYVHVFGVTGYNTGTYYAEQNAESWREFEDLYDECVNAFETNYGKFPWIITEFASSSIGGDKVQWVKNMFEVLPKYKNIKMAFWFNSADWDPSYPKETVISRPYWLDESDEVLKAFADGVKAE